MATGLHQVVSEHSILSARNDTQRQKKMEFGTEDIQHCVPEWKERFEEMERHWKKRRKPEEKRCRTRRHHAPTRRSGRRDKILKKMEEILVDLRSSISDLRKKSDGEKEAGETGREIDVFDKETRSEGKPELVTMEEQREGDSPKETTPTESSPNLLESAAVKVEMMRTVCDEEMFPSPWNKRLDGSGREETPEDSPSEARPEDSPSVAPCLGRTTMEVPPRSVAEEQGLNLVYDGYDRSGLEKNARVEWNVGEVELDISLGQAQASISKAALIIKSTQVFSKPSQSNNGERVQEWVGSDWTLLKMGHVFNSGSQAQTINITLFVHEGGFPLKKEVQKIMGLFLQALHVIFPTTEQHHIRIFNVPPQSCLVTSLFDDHLSPTYANKRLEKLSPTNFWLIVKDENGRSHDLQLLFKVLVGVGGHYDNGSIQLTNISLMDKPPLVHPWGLGGFKNIEWDPGGIRKDEYIQESHITYACYGLQQNQYYQVLVASTLPESMRYKGTKLLHFLHVRHPMAKQAWDTRIDLLDTNSGALTESTRTQDKPLSISLILLKSTGLSISIEEIKLSYCTVTSLVEEITIWGYIAFNDPLEMFFLVCRLSGVSMELDLKMLALKLFGEQRVIPSLQKILFGNSEWRELSWSTKVILAGVLINYGTLTAYGNFFTIANWQLLKFIDRIIKLLTLQQMRKLAPYSNTLALRIFLEIHKVEASWIYITCLLIKCAFKKKTKWVVGNEILDTCDDLIPYSIEDYDSSLQGMNDHSANHLISFTSFIISDIVRPTHHKQWNPGAHDCFSGFLWTMSCKQWDPGGILVAVGFWHLHLEDKVNFEGEGVDTNSSQGGQIGKIPKVYEGKKWKPIIWGPQCKHSIDCNKLPTWQLREGRIFS